MTGAPILLALCLAGPPGPVSLTPPQVAQAIAARRDRVAEFRLIKEAAEELGFRVWLFGGTAAGFAHYVRNDLAREAGDTRYRQSFFDYDFTNIYRSTQDADLVVDATPEQAVQLENLVKQKMSFLQGSKEHWEVRLLRHDRVAPGGQLKQALLANPDFLEQNTDSNSTGMIELTDPPGGESTVRDLRDWQSALPFFLRDVTEGRLHYYRSPTHRNTSRFRSGDNPELFSVIRYLVKAFQYDLKVDGDDLKQVRAVIDAFDPGRDYRFLSQWARGWLERYGPNLIRHAVNIEYAWDTLEELALREKLVSLSRPEEGETLGWWLSREPLRTRPVGRGTGRTAAELGLEVVAHETNEFLSYESITRDTTLRPNVLVSRPGHEGELASYGPGFYTRKGRIGAKGTGLTIRFTVDPGAREGSDFTVQGDYVVFQNRAALRVVPETLDLTLFQYFELLREGMVGWSDRGSWMKLQRRLSLRPLAEGEWELLKALLLEEIDQAAEQGRDSLVLREWFALPWARLHPEPAEKLAAVMDQRIEEEAARVYDRHGNLSGFLCLWRDLPLSLDHPEMIERLIRRGPPHDRKLEEKSDGFVALNLLNYPGWGRYPGLVRILIEKGNIDQALAEHFLRRDEWSTHPELVDLLLDKGDPALEFTVAHRTLSWEAWGAHPELLLRIIAGMDHPDSRIQEQNMDRLLQRDHWRENPVLRELCGGNDPTLGCVRSALSERSGEDARRLVQGLAALGSPSPGECP